MKESLKDLAIRVECKADDLEFIRVRGNRALIRLANLATGGDTKLVTKEWLESYEIEIDAESSDWSNLITPQR